MVEKYAFTHAHPTLQWAAGYVFSCQSGDGDIRGIIGQQYMPYYHGAILELLIEAGFEDDARVKQGLDWFVEHQEADGLWPTGYGSGKKAAEARRWVGLAKCRVLKDFCSFSLDRTNKIL